MPVARIVRLHGRFCISLCGGTLNLIPACGVLLSSQLSRPSQLGLFIFAACSLHQESRGFLRPPLLVVCVIFGTYGPDFRQGKVKFPSSVSQPLPQVQLRSRCFDTLAYGLTPVRSPIDLGTAHLVIEGPSRKNVAQAPFRHSECKPYARLEAAHTFVSTPVCNGEQASSATEQNRGSCICYN